MPRIRISLANKCQLLFGAAVLLIISAALMVLWGRMSSLIVEAQFERARALALTHLTEPHSAVPGLTWLAGSNLSDFTDAAERDPFVAWALGRFADPDAPVDLLRKEKMADGTILYRYARIVRWEDGGLRGLILIDEPSEWARRQALLNRVHTIVAGLLAVLLAIVVFWLITTRLILSPVRVLRDTAEKVAEGDLNIRSVIHTGDEFEQLSDTFNTMLTNLKSSQDKLRELNRQLDVKIGELAESNLSLYEANRIKGEFLANVSHELRTPLNSIVGFAEVLSESLGAADGGPGDKRRRYLENILTSGRSLLSLITELLDLAKIEAGRVDVRAEKISVSDICEVLLGLIRPQADRKRIDLKLNVPRRLPAVQTDPGKFQQILFNFLSNAVKFTPEGGRVELGAAAIAPRPEAEPTGVKVWVSDTGPGIAPEAHAAIFEKFHQLDPSHTREHGGTGLGLAISRELARLLQGRIDLDSDVGQGATFTLLIPLSLRPEQPEALMPQGTAV